MAVHAGKQLGAAVIFHITRKSEWQSALSGGSYAASSLNIEGFMHCSTIQQVVATANRLFRGRNGLVLLCIATDRVQAEIRYENLEGGSSLFPHIYGTLDIGWITAVHDLSPRDDGCFDLPPALSPDTGA